MSEEEKNGGEKFEVWCSPVEISWILTLYFFTIHYVASGAATAHIAQYIANIAQIVITQYLVVDVTQSP